ncbi:MAG: response regulator [Magnetococcales bacterium]|nr:response regulator [Magnetococcales bacterium]
MNNPEKTPRKTILVVDDTTENIDVMKGILSPYYKIQAAKDGKLAIMIAKSANKPSLILLDIMMPGMDGYEVCKTLKEDEQTRDIPILFVTAKSGVEDETKGFDLGAVDYLVKPVSQPVVLARVKTHIEMNAQRMLLDDQKKLLEDQVAKRTEQLLKRNVELEVTRIEVINQLGRAVEYRDNETGMHVARMSCFAQILALKAGVGEAQAELINHAAPMHDIGKIGIPDKILLKPGKLTQEEFAVIKKHPIIGHKIIGKQSADILNLGAEMALTHHEKWNGEGYPNGLKGEDIPFAGRLIAVGDVFEALISVRPYKKAWSVDDALAYISQEAGGHFDPNLARLFTGMRSEIEEILDMYKDNPE